MLKLQSNIIVQYMHGSVRYVVTKSRRIQICFLIKESDRNKISASCSIGQINKPIDATNNDLQGRVEMIET